MTVYVVYKNDLWDEMFSEVFGVFSSKDKMEEYLKNSQILSHTAEYNVYKMNVDDIDNSEGYVDIKFRNWWKGVFMENDEIIQWVKVIKTRIENINPDDIKDFNDITRCCDDLILKLQGKNNDTKWEYWKV